MSEHFADEYLPMYDISDAVAVVVEAEREMVWEALLQADLLEVGCRSPMVGVLGAIRILPDIVGHLLHGEPPDKPPESMRLGDLPSIPMSEGGWVLLGQRPGPEIALGGSSGVR